MSGQVYKTMRLEAGILEDILNKGLRVLMVDMLESGDELATFSEGDFLALEETVNLEVTGRIFYAQVCHCPDPKVAQIILHSKMSAINEETGKREVYPMAGEFANEAVIRSKAAEMWVSVSGEKPIWVYEGVKWVGEISIAKALLNPAMLHPPIIVLKASGPGGEKFFQYTNPVQVNP